MSRVARRQRARIAGLIPDQIDLVIVAIRAGMTPTRAVAVAATFSDRLLADAFDEVAHRQRRGQRLADALSALPEMLGPSASGLADTLATADRYGSPLEPALDRLVIDVRSVRRCAVERHARTLPVKMAFPLVFCTLPSFVLMAILPGVLAALSTLTVKSP